MSQHDRLLRRALRGNAAFSIVSAAVLVAFNATLRGFMGIDLAWLLPAVAGGLVLFAIDLLISAAKPVLSARRAWGFVALDTLWVAGSAVLIGLGLLTSTGHWIVGGVALIVADFAILQYAGLRRLQRAGSAA